MLSQAQVIELLSGKTKIPDEIKKKLDLWRGVYYRMSLHIDGACPWFYSMRYDVQMASYVLSNKRTYPNNYFGVPYQELFDNYHFSAHPKEDPAQRNWRYSQYKPFTQDPFLKVIDVIKGAIFQDSGYVIKIEDTKDAEYIDSNSFDNKTLVDYLASKFGNVASDPSGFFVVIPSKRRDDYKTGEDIRLNIEYVFSKNIIYISPDEIVFEQEGVKWHINSIGYFRYQKQGDTWFDMDSDVGGYYAHMLDRLPIVQGGGKWNAQGFYDSWLLAARSYADEFISGKSAEQLVNKEASYPYIIESNVECPTCNGLKTVEVDCGHEGDSCNVCMNTNRISVNCRACNGSGHMSRNPGERLIVSADQMKDDLIKIISPDISINKHHADSNAAIFKGMLDALHLNYIDQAQSGVAKTIDLETRHQFLISISKDWFGRIIYDMIGIILAMRNTRVSNDEVVPDVNKTYTIIPPFQFQLQTSSDLAAEYKVATESNLPSYVRQGINTSFVDKQFGGDPLMKRKAELIGYLDFLNIATPEEIQVWTLNGAASQRDVKLHVMLPNILDNIIRDMTPDRFLSASFEAIKAEVNRIFNSIAPIIPPIQPTYVEERLDV